MSEIKIYSKSIQEALNTATREMKGSGTRHDLIEAIGLEMYNKLCALGYLTQGATLDIGKMIRVPVWKITNKPNLFDEIDREATIHERLVGEALGQITL